MPRFNFSNSASTSGIIKISGICILLIVSGTLLLNSCTKDPTIPILKTNPETEVTINSVTIGGEITDDGGSPVTARGICWGTAINPSFDGHHTTDGKGSGIFSTTINGLLPNTIYHSRAYAENSVGIAYGNEIVFTTSIAAPEVTTVGITDITPYSAISGGKIIYDGGAAIIAKGVCWSTSPEPDISDSFTTNGTDTSRYQSIMASLLPGTKYYVRAYAKNISWTAYGEEVTFNTKIEDAEGNLYNTVTIGTQVWMSENLRATKYNDETNIPNVTDDTEWLNLSSDAYCWYNNDIAYKPTLGALYSWYTIREGELCPTGWHVPTDAEYNSLELYLGMNPDSLNIWGWRGTDQGEQIKSITGWVNGGNGTNSSGFNGLSGGYRQGASGKFYALGVLTYWWTATDDSANGQPEVSWYRRLDAVKNDIYKATTYKKGGKYIRCLKD
jgi:uncharacterized protein (TIGR02145 family)